MKNITYTDAQAILSAYILELQVNRILRGICLAAGLMAWFFLGRGFGGFIAASIAFLIVLAAAPKKPWFITYCKEKKRYIIKEPGIRS